jgi:hypothetical protein
VSTGEAEQKKECDHETSFCSNVSGGLCRWIYSWLCTRRRWARCWLCTRRRGARCWLWQRIWSWRLWGTADARLPKPDSGSARGPRGGTHHQRSVVTACLPRPDRDRAVDEAAAALKNSSPQCAISEQTFRRVANLFVRQSVSVERAADFAASRRDLTTRPLSQRPGGSARAAA